MENVLVCEQGKRVDIDGSCSTKDWTEYLLALIRVIRYNVSFGLNLLNMTSRIMIMEASEESSIL